jgi:(E)-4-hydroxy-3-methylbut-2-enyl-diphosphate synthase
MALFNFKSKVVNIGNLPMGGDYPIRIQSMTSTNTMDTPATVEQSIRMIEAGCEYVRITAPGIKEAKNLANIKKELRKKGYTTPLIADIHYQPKAAEVAARIVEKVRINPGNYVDRKQGRLQFTESEYNAELEKIRERIKPLIHICKETGTAMRIGSNHGSLSERILLKYGDTPEGMVESALEFVRICEDLDYTNIVLSMKASNVKVMIHANRLLVKKMTNKGMNYPIHLGVTEAGDAEDGRIKSAAGIGPLLVDSIGDTIRVSLTEEPEFEIPVAKNIINSINKEKYPQIKNRKPNLFDNNLSFNPFKYNKRETDKFGLMGGSQVPVVIISSKSANHQNLFSDPFIPDYIHKSGSVLIPNKNEAGQIEFIDYNLSDNSDTITNFVNPIIIEQKPGQPLSETRNFIQDLMQNKITVPVIFKKNYTGLSSDEFLVSASIDCTYFLADGLLDGIWLDADQIDLNTICETSFGILQATGARISKAEYIACPSCGRTQFRIQDALQKIKAQTSHLKGIKIGIMGCCVNGPGEMADADYGFVGAGKAKITLYKSNRIVKQGINENEAVDELINLIKTDGKWIDK